MSHHVVIGNIKHRNKEVLKTEAERKAREWAGDGSIRSSGGRTDAARLRAPSKGTGFFS